VKPFIILPFFIITTLLSYSQDRITGHDFATRSEILSRYGIAATSQPLATQTAIDILRRGGNAIDAAIAANAVLCVVEPTGAGIGGDLVVLIWSAEKGRIYGLNATGRSPIALKITHFYENDIGKIPAYGPLNLTVPGCIDGWYEMNEMLGKLSMKDILQPAINYAREGFPVSEVVAYQMEIETGLLAEYPNIQNVFMPGGKSPGKGEIFRNPLLAATLEKLVKGGRYEFYRGSIAKSIDFFIRSQGGFLSYNDFARYHSEWIDPVRTGYRGYDIWTVPPSGQGISALQLLNMLEGYDPKEMKYGSSYYIHILTEAKKIAFEDRAKYLSDPLFNPVPVNNLISKKYAAERRKLINEKSAAKIFESGQAEQGNTVYLTVADRYGNMVSLIQSNGRGMGSGMCPTGMGFVLQNRGEMFSLAKGDNNVYAPGKRPFQSLAAFFITKNNKPLASIGMTGGDMIPQGITQCIVNIIDFGMNIQEACDAPRIHHSGSSSPTGELMTDGGVLLLESGFRWEVIQDLVSLGHRAEWKLGGYGGFQGIMWDEKNKVWHGASDPRLDGQASGY